MRRAAAIAVLMVLVAAACSDDGGGPDTTSAEDTATTDGTAAESTEPTCDWPMWGHGVERTFNYPCESGISGDTVDELRRVWFFNTSDVVTAAPTVVDGRLYVGDWAGRFYALDAQSGEEEWHFDTEVSPLVYAGQITSSATYATIDEAAVVVFAGGRTVYALDAERGEVVWTRELGEPSAHPTEIEAPPLVVEDKVLVGYDVHNGPFQAGVVALDLATGDELWSFDPEDGDNRGCGDVWGGISVDLDHQLAYVGTGSCPSSPEGWGPYTEAAIALDLGTGEVEWSFQPHEPNNDDLDFAGTPPLFTADGRDLVGFGNKDAVYYALERATGEVVWSTQVTEPGLLREGGNYSSGGFIGPAAYSDGVIVGGTGVGDCPCMHALDAATGEILWQQPVVGPTYAPTTVVNDVAFVGSLDFTLRALDVRDGSVLWSDELSGLVSGGVAVVGDDLWAVAGFREPGLDGPAETAGVTRYTVDPSVEATEATVPPSTIPVGAAGLRLVDPLPTECLGEPCSIPFVLKDPPPGTSPEGTLLIEPDPFRITIETTGLGDPAAWIQPGTPAAEAGASAYGLFISERDDDPNGGYLCVLDDGGRCTGESVPRPGASYSRISVLAVADTDEVPSPADGFSRLVTTISFEPPLTTDAAGSSFVLSGQGNDLVAYDVETFASQRVITNASDDEDGRDINGQLCRLDGGRLLTGEDTGQPDPPAGYGIFELTGNRVGMLGWKQVAKLTPTYQEAASQPENYGCGQLPDGRILTTDIGNQELGDGTGQLIVWFPPFEGDDVAYCKIDVEVATAQSLLVNGGDVLLASARPPTGGVWRYTGDFPTGPDAAGGCGRTDPTGAPLVDEGRVTKALMIPAGEHGLASIVGLAPAPEDGVYASSVISGVITEHDGDGTYRRTILEPPPGAALADGPYPGGTPLGMAVADDGTLFFADLGVVIDDGGIGPGERTGSVRRIRFVDGKPQEPEVVEGDLAFPDGVLVVEAQR